MEVKPITNNQPHFNGYVDKSVRKYIKKAIKNESSIQLKKGTFNTEKMYELKNYGEKILKNLYEYMSKTDKKTRFTLGNVKYNNYPRFKNPISSHIIRIYAPTVDGKVRMDEFGEIAMPKTPTLNSAENARDIDLVKLERYYNKLKTIDPKEIDKAFYNAEKEKLNEIPEEELGFFAGIIRTFKEAKIENFFAKILERN